MCPKSVRAVLEITEGFVSERLFPPCDHHQTHLAIGRCSLLFTWGMQVGLLPETFLSLQQKGCRFFHIICYSKLKSISFQFLPYISQSLTWMDKVVVSPCVLAAAGWLHISWPDISSDNGFCADEKFICPLHLFIKEKDFSAGMPSRDAALTCQAAWRHFTHKVFNKTSKQHYSNTYK